GARRSIPGTVALRWIAPGALRCRDEATFHRRWAAPISAANLTRREPPPRRAWSALPAPCTVRPCRSGRSVAARRLRSRRPPWDWPPPVGRGAPPRRGDRGPRPALSAHRRLVRRSAPCPRGERTQRAP